MTLITIVEGVVIQKRFKTTIYEKHVMNYTYPVTALQAKAALTA
jgi:hypothetical protein